MKSFSIGNLSKTLFEMRRKIIRDLSYFQRTLIDSPNVKSWMTCFISPVCGWLAAECVETWKFPGTRLMLNEALIRQPAPSLSGVFNVLSIKPTSCRPRSSWISIPTTKNEQILTNQRNISFEHGHGIFITLMSKWTGIRWATPLSFESTNNSLTLKKNKKKEIDA